MKLFIVKMTLLFLGINCLGVLACLYLPGIQLCGLGIYMEVYPYSSIAAIIATGLVAWRTHKRLTKKG